MGIKDAFIAMLAVKAKAQHEAKAKLSKSVPKLTPKQAKAVRGKAGRRAKRHDN